MKKPNNYENTQAQGEFKPVELGGHYLVIKEVLETVSKSTGKDMIKVSFDFAKNDKQAGYFAESFKNDIRPDKKWSNQATKYILTEDNDGNCSRAFKTFITCVEHSNNMTVQWGENFGAQFKNKLVGGIFGLQMDYYEGRERENVVLRWFTSNDKVKEAQIPDMSETQAYRNYIDRCHSNSTPVGDGFINIPDGIDEELPFN